MQVAKINEIDISNSFTQVISYNEVVSIIAQNPLGKEITIAIIYFEYLRCEARCSFAKSWNLFFEI